MALNPTFASWHGQKIWVIGASTGIGASCAKQLIEAGATVAMTARKRQGLEEVSTQASKPQDAEPALLLPCDVTDRTALKATYDRLIEQWGTIDLILVIAGNYIPMRAESFDADEARRLIEINLLAPFDIVALALPKMIEHKRGGIALVASVAGYRGLPKALAYGPSKGKAQSTVSHQRDKAMRSLGSRHEGMDRARGTDGNSIFRGLADRGLVH